MNKRNIIKTTIWAVFLILIALAIVNLQTLKDIYFAMTFKPTPEMSEIQEKLNLTEKGKRIFLASAPEIVDAEQFNESCNATGSEVSTLGCFNGQKIYIYNVDSEELDGIKESTSAHELLHAVWSRLSTAEKENLTPVLESFYEKSDEKFKDSLKTYQEKEKIEETFVRSATQIRDLPETLEKEFAKIFENQDSIVKYYDAYITPFDKINEEIDTLSAELETLGASIDQKRTDYENRSASLGGQIGEFNNCAATAGCFASSYAFYNRRNELLAEQNSLNDLYNTLDAEINFYNEKVNLYNSKIIKGKELNTQINSNKQLENLAE